MYFEKFLFFQKCEKRPKKRVFWPFFGHFWPFFWSFLVGFFGFEQGFLVFSGCVPKRYENGHFFVFFRTFPFWDRF